MYVPSKQQLVSGIPGSNKLSTEGQFFNPQFPDKHDSLLLQCPSPVLHGFVWEQMGVFSTAF